jgi:hypothetical protein
MPAPQISDHFTQSAQAKIVMTKQLQKLIRVFDFIRSNTGRNSGRRNKEVFESYRELIEDLASKAFDAEGPFDRHGRVLVTSEAIARVTRRLS